MTTASVLQAATANAVQDLNAAVTQVAALKAQIAALTADGTATHAALDLANARNGTLTAQVVGLQGQITDLSIRLAGAQAALVPLQADAARWQRARIPEPTTYDQFFKDGGITSVALSGPAADAAMDLDIAGKTPVGTFLGMYSMTVVKP